MLVWLDGFARDFWNLVVGCSPQMNLGLRA